MPIHKFILTHKLIKYKKKNEEGISLNQPLYFHEDLRRPIGRPGFGRPGFGRPGFGFGGPGFGLGLGFLGGLATGALLAPGFGGYPPYYGYGAPYGYYY